jgi:predicted Fe-Mo cluster-binding NifX family protein
VAIGSADGKFVHEHFGRATRFQVFDLTGDVLRFVETRITTPACQHDGHDDQQLQRTINVISDVDVVLVAAIGPSAEAALVTRGIRAFAIQDFIPDALRALQKAVSRAHLSGKSTILQQFWRTDHEQET